jgi:hypothetical protein
LLREPIEGRVDFIHRTFQEYLGAKEAVDQDNIQLLINDADKDQWREVIVLAGGHARPRQRETLIDGLLDRAQEDSNNKHRLQLLAISCLETASELAPNLSERLSSLLAELVPPRNMGEARALSSAGELAVPLLVGHNAAAATRVAATVRTLSTIGGERALSALESYGPDQRVTVARELIRAWELFPDKDFAKRVLRESILDYGHLFVRFAGQVSELRFLENLTDASVALYGREVDLTELAGLTSLKHLRLLRIPNLRSLIGLEGCSGLESIQLKLCRELEDVSAIQSLPSLRRLICQSAPSLSDISPVREVEHLRFLNLDFCPGITRLPRMPSLSSLVDLSLTRSAVTNLEVISEFKNLNNLNLSGAQGPSDMSWANDLPLDRIRASRAPNLEWGSTASSTVSHLALSASDLEDLDFLENFPKLEILDISENGRISDLSPLATLTSLREVNLVGLGNVSDFGPLEHLDGADVTIDGRHRDLRLSEEWRARNSLSRRVVQFEVPFDVLEGLG